MANMNKTIAYTLIALAAGVLIGFYGGRYLTLGKVVSTDVAKEKVMAFFTESGYEGVEVEDVIDEGGANYKVLIDYVGQKFTSYVSKNGEMFFQFGSDLTGKGEESVDEVGEGSGAAAVAEVSNKSEKPNVELFVMSHCPYGTQVEKGLLPVLGALGDSVDFELKFVNYAMHGKKEIDEQLRQYCIQEQGRGTLEAYLGCFLEDENSGDTCAVTAGVNEFEMNNCVARVDGEFNVTADFDNQDTWKGSYPSFSVYDEDNLKYGVQGSPTLVINGEEVSSGRDPSSLLAVACSAFENAPEGCGVALSSDVPSAGFGTGVAAAGGASNASCN
jgi:glutaredoxin